MPQLPAWSPPVELSSRLEAAVTQLAALAPPLQKVRADGSLDAAATQRLAEAASAEWEAVLRELEREVDLQHHARRAERGIVVRGPAGRVGLGRNDSSLPRPYQSRTTMDPPAGPADAAAPWQQQQAKQAECAKGVCECE